MKRIPRRKFLTDYASSTVALTTLGALSAHHLKAAPTERMNVAVIGLGGMGRYHTKALLERPDVHIKILCDVDQNRAREQAGVIEKQTGKRPAIESDYRRVYDNRDIHAVTIATPHHWHMPTAIPALQAGKDLYLEKPGSHVFREGRLLVEAAKKYGRIVQHGTQMRSSEVTKRAGEVLESGILGEIKMSKAWNVQGHRPIPPTSDTPVPNGVDYDMWLGPAPKRPFNSNRFHGKWNWFTDYGNGDIGGDGIHDLDMARWGLGVTTHPVRITAHGSRIELPGERQFPDNMSVAYHYAEGKVLLYEDRGFAPYGMHGFDSGNAFYGTKGYMIFSRRGYFQVYFDRKGEEKGPGMKGDRGHPTHMHNFVDCVRSRKQTIAPAEVAHLSCGLVHLGETAYRAGRVLHFEPQSETIKGDPEANALLTKEYRSPWTIPDTV
ncbi:MAG: Gfo/Idh/MocA family oxidoreductase [Planctomycetes bacterium]|nr:Gfo/Idh/MocA family oxidoreductase [Planctomycetota bacterium]